MITISPAALTQLQTLLPSGSFFRIEVTAGGCSGFSHRFEICNTRTPEDTEISGRVLVDSTTVDLLGATVLDYETNIAESKFVLKIAEATNTCGCGKSFSI
jgi:iron-sulfur cluster assembly accessory protein